MANKSIADRLLSAFKGMPYLPVTFDEVAELTDTNRGEGGFGSTGK